MSRDLWMMVGASSAVARAFARLVAVDGADLVLAGRDRDDLEAAAADLRVRYGAAAEALSFDALSLADQAALLARAERHDGPVKLFVALGLMPEQAASAADPALLGRVIETNFTAVAQLLTRFAPFYEARRTGQVVVLGSVAGDRGRYSNYIYGSAKAGLHAYLQGYRARLYHAGVPVTTVKPGFIDTAMTWGLKLPPLPMASPEACAEACREAAARGRAVVYVPRLWWLVMTIIRHVPETIFRRLKF